MLEGTDASGACVLKLSTGRLLLSGTIVSCVSAAGAHRLSQPIVAQGQGGGDPPMMSQNHQVVVFWLCAQEGQYNAIAAHQLLPT